MKSTWKILLALECLVFSAACSDGTPDAPDACDGGDAGTDSGPDAGAFDGMDGPNADDAGGDGVSEPFDVVESFELGGFKFGVEYSASGWEWYAPYFSSKQVVWTKTNGDGWTVWRDLEPDPPVDGQHNYRFDSMDESVAEWQAQGLSQLVVVIRAASAWAGECGPPGEWLCPDPPLIFGFPSSPPKDQEHLGYYADMVRALVERFDGDGVDDAPGLLEPIRYWEIETEAQQPAFWQVVCDGCTSEERHARRIARYLLLLQTARQAAHEANPQARIILSGAWLWDLFDRGPLTPAQLQETLASLGEDSPFAEFPKLHIPFNIEALAATDLFDAVEIHQLTHYTGVEGSIRWMREMMGPAGADKEIFIGDCLTGPTVMHTYPFQEWEYPDGENLFEVIAEQSDLHGYTYTEVETWLRAEQSRYTAKQVLLALGTGAAGINLFTWTDAPGLINNPIPGFRTWGIQGLYDAQFNAWGITESLGEPRPVMVTYWYLAEKLSEASLAERMALDPGVRAYRFSTPAGHIWALWLEEPIARQPGEPEPSATLQLPLQPGIYRLTRLPTLRGEPVQTSEIEAGTSVEITDMPALIEPL